MIMKMWKMFSVLCILVAGLIISTNSTVHKSYLAYEDGAGPMVIAPHL